MEDENEESILDYLIELGIITEIDDISGEKIYKLSDDAEFFLPGIMEEHQKQVNDSIFDLWTMDMIDVRFDEIGDPLVSLNDNSLSIEKVNAIEDPRLRIAMYTILVAFSEKFDI